MPPANFSFGWVIVIASFIVLTVAYGLQFSYGIFLPFIADDLGLSRATATAPLSLYRAPRTIECSGGNLRVTR
jgi:hypothetical protein